VLVLIDVFVLHVMVVEIVCSCELVLDGSVTVMELVDTKELSTDVKSDCVRARREARRDGGLGSAVSDVFGTWIPSDSLDW
jgi:hypothetical protein